MIQLVEPQAPEVDMSLASAARYALAADAVVMVDLGPGRDRRVLAADGLSDAELDAAISACAAAPIPARGTAAALNRHLVSGFAAAMFREARLPGVGAAAICALRRGAGSFKNADLALAFANHAAVSFAAGRHARVRNRFFSGEGALDALGIWSLEEPDYAALNVAIAEELGAATGATSIGVLVWDEAAQLLRPVPGAFGSDPDVLPPAHAARDWGSSAARVFATGEPYLTNCAAEDPGVLQDYVGAFGFRRLMSLPLDVGPRRIGVLQVANKPTSFTIADLLAAAAHGGRIAAGVQIVRTRQASLRRQRLEELLGSVAVDIASGSNLQEFLGAALESLAATVRASLITLVARTGKPMILRRGGGRGDLEPMILAQARETTSLRTYGVGPRRAGEPGWSAAHVPIVLDGKQVATLSALRRGGEFFDSDECGAFSRLANLVALAWATERYQRQLADSARLTERQRIADELHDQVAQLLFAARLSLDFAIEMPDVPDPVNFHVRRGRDLLLRADAATRQVMQHLSHVAQDGLPDRLTALVGGVEEEFGRPVQLEIAPTAIEPALRIGRPAMNLLARAAREALVNAAKHAGPCQLAVRVTVTRRNRLLLTVTDDGVGLVDRRDDGYGTAALRRAVRQHGGMLRVDESSTGGTKVAISLPL